MTYTAPTLPTAEIVVIDLNPTAAARVDLATAAHAALGIECYLIVEIDGDYTYSTAYVKSSRCQRQYVGDVVGVMGVPLLKARALTHADDIVAELTPPTPAAPVAKPAKKKTTRKAPAPAAPLKLITTLSNPTRDGLGIRAWLESVTTREGRKSVTEHRGFVQAPGRDAVPTDTFPYRFLAEAEVNAQCEWLILELRDAAA